MAASAAVGFLAAHAAGAMPEGHLSIPSDIPGPHASKDTTPSPTEGQLIGSLTNELARSSLSGTIGERATQPHARPAASDATPQTHTQHPLTNGHAHTVTHALAHGLAGLSISEHAKHASDEQNGDEDDEGLDPGMTQDDKGPHFCAFCVFCVFL